MERIEAITESTAVGLAEEINKWLDENEDPLLPDKVGKISFVYTGVVYAAFIIYKIDE